MKSGVFHFTHCPPAAAIARALFFSHGLFSSKARPLTCELSFEIDGSL
jgi:hypothetical protein